MQVKLHTALKKWWIDGGGHTISGLSSRPALDVLGMDYRQIESAMSKLHHRGLVEEAGTHQQRKIWRLTAHGRKYAE